MAQADTSVIASFFATAYSAEVQDTRRCASLIERISCFGCVGAFIAGILAVVVGCGAIPEPAAPLTPPTRLCRGAAAEAAAACLSPATVESWMHSPTLKIIGTDDPPAGKQGARVLTLRAGSGAGVAVFRAKWRAYDTISNLNRPRAELAAYAVQRLFLKPQEYIVPPTTGHCFRLDHYRALVSPDAAATFDATRCVFGVLSYWLEDVQTLEEAYDAGSVEADDTPFDRGLFKTNPTYRRSVAHLNMLTFVIHHGDAHPAQFLLAKGQDSLWPYVIDNSIAFRDFVNPDLAEHQDWSRMQVPAIPQASYGRLRALSRRDIQALGTVEAYEVEEGQLVFEATHGSPVPEGNPLQWMNGRLHIGLTPSELSDLYSRKQELTRMVASGKLDTF